MNSRVVLILAVSQELVFLGKVFLEFSGCLLETKEGLLSWIWGSWRITTRNFPVQCLYKPGGSGGRSLGGSLYSHENEEPSHPCTSNTYVFPLSSLNPLNIIFYLFILSTKLKSTLMTWQWQKDNSDHLKEKRQQDFKRKMGRSQLDLLWRIRVVIFRKHLGTCDWNVTRGPRWKYEFGTWQDIDGILCHCWW